MRIHTDVLTAQDLHAACNINLPAVGYRAPFWCEIEGEHGSRKRARAFECRLGAPRLPGRNYRNSGQYGAEGVYAATYHEHGWWMMTLFELDPEAIIVGAYTYDGVEGFHEQTEGQFRREPIDNALRRAKLVERSNEVREVLSA